MSCHLPGAQAGASSWSRARAATEALTIFPPVPSRASGSYSRASSAAHIWPLPASLSYFIDIFFLPFKNTLSLTFLLHLLEEEVRKFSFIFEVHLIEL